MARVNGVKEKLHAPIYDAFFVPGRPRPGEAEGDTNRSRRFGDIMTDPRMIRFFVDIQSKTKLETNLQAAGVLPSLNTFEARALRVVISGINNGKVGSPDDPNTTLNDADFLSDLIYNSVTTLLVGEKVMIEMPTFYFPAGAGVSTAEQTGLVASHGQPDPMATFRFAEPVFIEPQQNFRVEMLFPQGVPSRVNNVLGPLRIWVVLDGYLTRDVQ